MTVEGVAFLLGHGVYNLVTGLLAILFSILASDPSGSKTLYRVFGGRRMMALRNKMLPAKTMVSVLLGTYITHALYASIVAIWMAATHLPGSGSYSGQFFFIAIFHFFLSICVGFTAKTSDENFRVLAAMYPFSFLVSSVLMLGFSYAHVQSPMDVDEFYHAEFARTPEHLKRVYEMHCGLITLQGFAVLFLGVSSILMFSAENVSSPLVHLGCIIGFAVLLATGSQAIMMYTWVFTEEGAVVDDGTFHAAQFTVPLLCVVLTLMVAVCFKFAREKAIRMVIGFDELEKQYRSLKQGYVRDESSRTLSASEWSNAKRQTE